MWTQPLCVRPSVRQPRPCASNLLIPLVRFLPANDPRDLATIDRTLRELAPDGLVYRYLERDDGLPGGEATFVICSFWLVDNLALVGKTERARELFERLLGYANDVGLLAEELDPLSGELLGNFPQAFSHVGLMWRRLEPGPSGIGSTRWGLTWKCQPHSFPVDISNKEHRAAGTPLCSPGTFPRGRWTVMRA